MKSLNEQPVWYLDADQATFRSVIEIDPDALRLNYERLRQFTGRPLMPVLKSDAYGLGLPLVFHVLRSLNPPWIGVANPWEGLRLRRLGYRGRILVLSGFLPDEAPLLIQWNLTPAIYHEDQIAWLDRPERVDPIPVHLKIDTGMGRLGVPWHQIERFIERLKLAHHLRIEGVFSNLACADDPDHPLTPKQITRFRQVCDFLTAEGFQPEIRHLANSAGCHLWPDAWFDLVRPGLSLYGWTPEASTLTMAPVLRWWARVLQVRKLDKGWTVGYGASTTLDKETPIAVIGAGYFDGYDRRFSHQAHVLSTRGSALPVLGRVSMDLTIVACPRLDEVRIGEPVLLLGRWQNHEITLADLAQWAHTTPHEILCRIGPRVSRRLNRDIHGIRIEWATPSFGR